MNRHPLRAATALTASLLLAAPLAATVAPAAAGKPPWTVVASGLDNPRQLTFARNGALFVTEAGSGGNGPCVPGPEGGPVCFGTTGAVTRVTAAGQRRVLTRLPSLAEQDTGASAMGPSDITFTGHRRFVVAVGLGNDPAVRDALPAAGRTLGTLVRGKLPRDRWTAFADLAAYEAEVNPVNDPDSNPVGLVRQGSRHVVADAGGNTIVRTDRRGEITTLAVFRDTMVTAPPFLEMPPGTQIPMQFVPTSLAVGPDGAYYVSQLTGFPFPVGAASIWRFVPGERPTVYAVGLTNVTDLAFADDGTLYVVEIASRGLLAGPVGALVRIPPGGGPAQSVVDGLPAPYGVALRDGAAYVTTGSVAADAGQVVRIPLG